MTRLTDPYEAQEQQALVTWCHLHAPAHPELGKFYHVPNGEARPVQIMQTRRGPRRVSQAGQTLQRLGVKPGIFDLCWYVARQGYHGLYLEMKRLGKRNDLSEEQQQFQVDAVAEGYYATVCEGWIEAAHLLRWYFALPPAVVRDLEPPQGMPIPHQAPDYSRVMGG